MLILLQILLQQQQYPGVAPDQKTSPWWFIGTVIVIVSAIIINQCIIYEIHLSKIFRYLLPLSSSRCAILEERFYYYNRLSKDDQRAFRKRVHHFLVNKKFTSEDSIEITEEMKVMIAAAATLIMFHLEAYYLSHFDAIHISNNELESLQHMHKAKEVEIPWDDFRAGFDSFHDGYNPGLKILAMAFTLEHQLNNLSSKMFRFNRYYDLMQLYKNEAEKYIASGKSKYKEYSEVDRNEYFAVAVEYFFERPGHFYANQPAMYIALTKVLRQDPLGMYTYKRK
ncbi:zinc-dependent peptidase [Cytophaga hutchinsonii]|jgi:Mlc titration factor MtfA (ptsG expression regulator)|uniref:zinc-dependent peptidase n=1 Tax=Cytophaga hutchinsonii TaxID=985 RepID=UPI000038EB37|nr:zinc-dependent peptidase [Cytophaga hutchinsonii]SFX90014.1 Glucose-regulated metallo-peptidase M90 [Cytophaga hutchinsonii ATCC 33406]